MSYVRRWLASRLLASRRRISGRSGLLSLKSPGVRKPICVSAGQSSQASSDLGRFRSRIPGFPPGVVGPQAAKERSPTRCALVLGMEKKSGSGPKRN